MFKVDDKVWRGPRFDLIPRGFDTILNLEMGWYEWFHNRYNEEVRQCLKMGTLPIHFGLNNFGLSPSVEDLRACVSILNDPKFGHVYVHCKKGMDRTGMVIAAYRITKGWPVERAIIEMHEMGFNQTFYWFWEETLFKL